VVVFIGLEADSCLKIGPKTGPAALPGVDFVDESTFL
jgi:hypothetical protein